MLFQFVTMFANYIRNFIVIEFQNLRHIAGQIIKGKEIIEMGLFLRTITKTTKEWIFLWPPQYLDRQMQKNYSTLH